MYLASYNSVEHSSITATNITDKKLGASYRATNTPGYIYTINGAQSTVSSDDYWTGNETVDYTGYNSMYCGNGRAKGSYYWWLASPSAHGADRVCDVNGGNARLNSLADDTDGVCPLVSLKSGIQLTVK